MDIYTENQFSIIHTTSVDFVLRPCSKEIHIVQYDKSLPIIKVELYKEGERYVIPDKAAIALRLRKVDKTFVYKYALGCNQEYNTVYFDIDEQIALIPGKIWPVLEVIIDNEVACSSPLCFIIDRNPVQKGDIESDDYYPIIYEVQGAVAGVKASIKQETIERKAADEILQNNIDSIIDDSKKYTDEKVLDITTQIENLTLSISNVKKEAELKDSKVGTNTLDIEDLRENGSYIYIKYKEEN